MMYQFSCPKCDKSLPIPPSKAGQTIACAECGESIVLPKLGELKKLPAADASAESGRGSASTRSTSVGAGIGFATCILIAIACGLAGGMSAIRWALVDVKSSSQAHIEELREAYAKARAAELIREYEQLEKVPIELGPPYRYQVDANQKRSWGVSALIAAGIGLAAVISAWLFARLTPSPTA